MRWRIDLEYVGTDFAGWQLQPGLRTVQGEVERVLASLLGHAVRVRAGGRTDAGVHALMQVATFDTAIERTSSAIRDGLNSRLADDVCCLQAMVAPPEFDPRKWVVAKHYRYRWLDRRPRSAMRRGRVWHVKRGLDVESMARAATSLGGKHDFSSFRAVGCQATHPLREVRNISVTRHDDEVWLDIYGNGFLRHMVRIIAGSLFDVGRGFRPAEMLAEVLAARDRSRAGQTAPAAGLTLVEVEMLPGPYWAPRAL